MGHHRSLDELSLPASRVTIGAFDGVHRGHQQIIRSMAADEADGEISTVVLTFYPHPSVVLHGRRPSFYLTSPEEKAELLATYGVDLVVTETFDEGLSQVKATDFLDRLERHLGLRSLWVGPDFALGHRREGNTHYLQQAADARGFELHVVEPLQISGEVVSSTRIREALRSGDVGRAARYLGRWFEIPGTVVAGAGRGKDLGVPTANLDVWDERAYPRKGVYACFAQVEGQRLPAVTNVGVRPTFEGGDETPVIETHLLDFEREMYGEVVRLQFIDRLRAERRFDSPQELLVQIRRDIESARSLLAQAPANPLAGH